MEEDKNDRQPGEGNSGGQGFILPAFGLAEEVLGKIPGAESSPDKTNQDNGHKLGGKGGSAEEDLMKFVTFFLEKEEYGLPISQVQEINRVGEITRVPNSPDHVRGVINLRGRILPVIELKRRLGIGATAVTSESRIVVVDHGAKVLGLMVDRVAQVQNLSAHQIEPAPEEVVQGHANYIQGVGKLEGRMIILLNLEKIVGQEASDRA